jgi:phenylpropionate dioxygenase-like ring-hydroxylating dioxygenase large terminal subunit
MDHPRIEAVVRAAVSAAHRPEIELGERAEAIPVAAYTDPARLAQERAHLFRRLPIPLAVTSELAEPRRAIVRELDGVSLILTRGDDGAVRGFRNACRHRGVRLMREDGPKKAFVCPYHGWTYGSDGALVHVPHPSAFPGCDVATHGLVPARVEERHGLVWASLDEPSPDVATHLGELDDELGSLGLGEHVVGARVVSEQRGNWKMLMEGFLEAYHIRNLHRASVYPFFFDARAAAERVGHHVRAATARRAARDATALRDLATPSYTIFPCTTLILHPDWTSVVTVQPRATDRFVWSHIQLIPSSSLAVEAADEARAHFARSFALIEENVFQKEDLLMCSEAQEGLATAANTALTFGLLESPALWLHDAVRSILGPVDDALSAR